MENLTLNVSLDYWQFSDLSSDDLRYSYFWTGFFGTAYTLIFILGLVENLTVIWVISSKRKMRTVTNIFLCNLAVADLLVVLFCVPVTLAANIFIPWIFGTVICKVVSYAQGVSVFASVYSLVAISADRCSALYSSVGKPNGFTKSQSKKVFLLIWSAALLITSPWLIVFEVDLSDTNSTTAEYIYPHCQENWGSYQYLGNVYFVVVNLLLSFLLPCIAILILNTIIFRNVKTFANRNYHVVNGRFNINGITKELVLISVVFVICWLPLYVLFAILKLFVTVSSSSSVMYVLIPIFQLFGAANSCVNPLLYAFHSKRFRKIVRHKFRTMCRRKKRRHVVNKRQRYVINQRHRQRYYANQRRWMQQNINR